MDPHYLAEITKNHMMFHLLSILRKLGYNEYKLKSGDLLTVDLDRAAFSPLKDHKLSKLAVCYICKIDPVTLEQIQEAAEDNTLATILQLSLMYDPFQLVFSKNNAKTLQHRLGQYLTQCFDTCIHRYGRNDVIVV